MNEEDEEEPPPAPPPRHAGLAAMPTAGRARRRPSRSRSSDRLPSPHRPFGGHRPTSPSARHRRTVGHLVAPIIIDRLVKSYNGTLAVRNLSFSVDPGRITGFLGPNGAGKTTTLRILVGLAAATTGTATFGGIPYAQLDKPQQSVGAVLDANFHPGRTGRNHLRVLAATAGASDAPGRRTAGSGRPGQGRPAAGRPVLAGHAAATGPGECAARRSRLPDPGRAGQRSRPRRHPLAAALPARLRRQPAGRCWSPPTC